jgi:molybdopterin-synthase adenylyltransferase
MQLNAQEIERYRRQIMMEGWGADTQQALKNSTVFVAGAGGLGSPVSIYLAVAGIGRLLICDFDRVELSNLNRQILHSPSRIGVKKAASAQATIEQLNPDVEVVPIETRIEADNVDALVGDAQLIVDCMDNFETRYLLNDAAIRKRIPLVHGSVWGLEGRLSFIHVPETACLRCIFQQAPPKEVFPVIGATPAVIGALQAMEAIKYLARVGKNLKGRLLVWDGNVMEFRRFATERDPECPSCGSQPSSPPV